MESNRFFSSYICSKKRQNEKAQHHYLMAQYNKLLEGTTKARRHLHLGPHIKACFFSHLKGWMAYTSLFIFWKKK
jgi:hypothetical protein